MSKLHDPACVAAATHCRAADVAKNLELILTALQTRGILTGNVAVGVLATVAVETAHTFEPVAEAYWLTPVERARHFDQTEYGRVDPQTGQRYYGRGFVQRTWRTGYQASATALKIDCVTHPDLLLQPANAANDLALFWATKPGLVTACNASQWPAVRRLVNGGTNGLEDFTACVTQLLLLAG